MFFLLKKSNKFIFRIATNFNNLSAIDFVRKCFHYFCSFSLYNLYFKLKFFFHFKKWDITFGKNITFKGIAYNIKIGKNLTISDNCIFEFNVNSNLEIGQNCFISYGVLISPTNKIIIGDNVQIGEYTSLRDSTHKHSISLTPMKFQGDIEGEIIIADDVWIGRGCIIMPNTHISKGVVIGANSVVKGHLEENGIYGGVPIKILAFRK